MRTRSARADDLPERPDPMEAALRVLHVEDDAVDAKVVARSLQHAATGRFDVERVETLAEARVRLAVGAYDVVALDLSLPDSFGQGTLDAVMATGTDAAIVVMTGFDDAELGLDLITRGAEDFLSKADLIPENVPTCFRFAAARHSGRVAVERARRDAEEASEAKSRFVASMSHEIRTPLNAIIGMADLLADAALAPDHRQYVEIFRRSGRNLLFLLNNVLELSSVESGRFELNEAPFSPAEIARTAVETFAYMAHKKRVNIATDDDTPPSLAMIGDGDRIRQVLVNLVGNAVKFTDEGHVLLRLGFEETGPGHGTLVFEVEDTGPGVPEGARESIFRSYRRADHGAQIKAGTGLGLALCVELVALMAGTLELLDREDPGACFRVTVPVTTRPAAAAEAARVDGRLVVVAAPDTVERDTLIKGLTQRGAMVGAIEAADQWSTRLGDAAVDALIVDCRMDGGGLELAEGLASESNVDVVVLLPLDHRREDASRCRAIGAQALLRPADPDAVCAALARSGPLPAAPPAGGEGAEAPPMRVLLAEDSPENRTLVLAYLAGDAFEVVVAENGLEAVAAACPGVFDVVLMDVNMPEMDGLAATSAIRAFEETHGLARTPILALTAYAFAEQADACVRAGCDAHLAKPIAKRDLLDAIARFGRLDLAIDSGHDMADLSDDYLTQRLSDVALLRRSLATEEFDSIEVCGHNMKGTGLGYGFPVASSIGAAIESAAKARDGAALERLARELEAFVARACGDGHVSKPEAPGAPD